MSFIGSEFTTTQILSLSILSANEIQLLLTLQESPFKKKGRSTMTAIKICFQELGVQIGEKRMSLDFKQGCCIKCGNE